MKNSQLGPTFGVTALVGSLAVCGGVAASRDAGRQTGIRGCVAVEAAALSVPRQPLRQLSRSRR